MSQLVFADAAREVRINLSSTEDEADEFVSAYPVGTHVMMNLGRLVNPSGIIRAYCPGRGPYVNPESKFDVKNFKYDETYLCSYLIEYADRRTDNIPCADVHDIWEIVISPTSSTETSESMTETEGVAAGDISSHACRSLLSHEFPPQAHVLIVTGFFLASESCFYSKRLGASLANAGAASTVTEFGSPDQLIDLLHSNTFTACVIIGFGSGGPSIWRQFNVTPLQELLVSWVQCGGRLLLHGEGCIAGVFKSWFHLPWSMASYGREHSNLAEITESLSVPAHIVHQLPKSYYAKACSLVGVSIGNRLYSFYDETVVAVANIGCGRVAFFGDVNAEQHTILTMTALAIDEFSMGEETG